MAAAPAAPRAAPPPARHASSRAAQIPNGRRPWLAPRRGLARNEVIMMSPCHRGRLPAASISSVRTGTSTTKGSPPHPGSPPQARALPCEIPHRRCRGACRTGWADVNERVTNAKRSRQPMPLLEQWSAAPHGFHSSTSRRPHSSPPGPGTTKCPGLHRSARRDVGPVARRTSCARSPRTPLAGPGCCC